MIEALLVAVFGIGAFVAGGMIAMRGAIYRVKLLLGRMLSQGRIGPVDAAEIIDTLEGRI